MNIQISDIYVLIVIYNKHCYDSDTYQAIKELKGIHLIVCDNSTSDYHNKETVENEQHLYLSMNGNKGLSKAYNKAISQIKHKTDKYLCIFDDDTKISSDFFEKVLDNINKYHADVFLPVVKTKKMILSPCLINNNRISMITEGMDIATIDNTNKISGINSGMVVNLKVYDSITYNENLFLDNVDHDFMRNVNEYQLKIKIMDDLILYQNYSQENNSLKAACHRLKISKHDLKEFYKDDYCYYLYQIIGLKYKLFKKYKSMKILFI